MRLPMYSTFKGDDLAGGVHDGTVGRDRSSNRVCGVRQVHDHHLVLIAHLLSDTDELVRLHGQIAEPYVGWVHAQALQLETNIRYKVRMVMPLYYEFKT